ncbi:hypothetical protein K1719_033432 [Acacia pycnantha]|nr:hypothetical protein K1719_033432 [Acacia pycnantha]
MEQRAACILSIVLTRRLSGRLSCFVSQRRLLFSALDSSFLRKLLSIVSACKDARRVFQFNKVFATNVTQEQIYGDTQPLIRSILDALYASIFPYGQTGSRKTYTRIEEGEAQCALLNSELLCDGCFSSDSDIFLFGARTVYRDICLDCIYRDEKRHAYLNLDKVQGLHEVKAEAYSFFNGQLHGNRVWTGVVYGIGVTLIEPLQYSSLFSREMIYGYPDDFERQVRLYH